LSEGLREIIDRYKPGEAAIEETFVSVNGASTLKLGQARGALLLTLAQAGLPVAEYAATLVKKSIVGAGRAEKHQVAQMVRMILPSCGEHGADAMDALAIAICHAHHVPLARMGKQGGAA
jgi:crossover junction endodeoxyribonuclease RuvC